MLISILCIIFVLIVIAISGTAAYHFRDRLKDLVLGVKTVSGCANDGKTLSCPAGKTIVPGKMKFGRWDNTVCPHETVTATTPSVSKYYDFPDAAGKTSWQMPVPTRLIAGGDDPTPGIYKQYSISYRCQ